MFGGEAIEGIPTRKLYRFNYITNNITQIQYTVIHGNILYIKAVTISISIRLWDGSIVQREVDDMYLSDYVFGSRSVEL